MGWMFVELERGEERVVLPNQSVVNSVTIHYGPSAALDELDGKKKAKDEDD